MKIQLGHVFANRELGVLNVTVTFSVSPQKQFRHVGEVTLILPYQDIPISTIEDKARAEAKKFLTAVAEIL